MIHDLELEKEYIYYTPYYLEKFQQEHVSKILRQGWAIDEMIAGVPFETIEDEIWKDFPKWIDNYLISSKEEAQEDYANA